MERERVYFGHPVNLYHTPKEAELEQKINEFFPELNIENPNRKIHGEGYQTWKKKTGNGMKYFYNQVLPNVKKGIFLPFEDGKFGAGVFKEAKWLADRGVDIYEINLNGEITKIKNLDSIRCLSIEETRKRVYGDKNGV